MQINLINKIQPAANLPSFGHKHAPHGLCHECRRPLVNRAGYDRPLQIRCITPNCGQTTFSPIDRDATTWTACKFI
jgi:hypothetical protein